MEQIFLYYHISETLNIHSDLSTVLDAGDMAMNNTDGFSTLMEMTLKRDRQEKKMCQVLDSCYQKHVTRKCRGCGQRKLLLKRVVFGSRSEGNED